MTVRIEPRTLLYMVTDWDPPTRPHCSNCLHAKVHGSPDAPITYCVKGQGLPMDLWRLIRNKRPVQFRPAVGCPDFASMDGP